MKFNFKSVLFSIIFILLSINSNAQEIWLENYNIKYDSNSYFNSIEFNFKWKSNVDTTLVFFLTDLKDIEQKEFELKKQNKLPYTNGDGVFNYEYKIRLFLDAIEIDDYNAALRMQCWQEIKKIKKKIEKNEYYHFSYILPSYYIKTKYLEKINDSSIKKVLYFDVFENKQKKLSYKIKF